MQRSAASRRRKARRMSGEGVSVGEIASELGVQKNAVWRYLSDDNHV